MATDTSSSAAATTDVVERAACEVAALIDDPILFRSADAVAKASSAATTYDTMNPNPRLDMSGSVSRGCERELYACLTMSTVV